MKILIILKTWKGGVGNAVKNVAKSLKAQGIEVDIVSRQENLKIYSLFGSLFKLRRKIEELMKNNYDIIYTQDWSIALPLLFPYKIYKDKHYCCFHGHEVSNISLLMQSFVAKSLKKRLIVVGDNLKERFPDSKLIYNGVDLAKFKPLSRKKIKNTVGFANWKTEEYHFNDIKEAIEKTGKTLVIAENVSAEKMPLFYNKIETFISLPSENTGFGLVWLEAMASGVKKIIGNNNGIGKILPIDKIENYNSIEEAILRVKPRDYRKWLIKNRKKFDWNNSAYQLIKYINH